MLKNFNRVSNKIKNKIMKKVKLTGKLGLNKETIVKLNDGQLFNVNGGARSVQISTGPSCIGASCNLPCGSNSTNSPAAPVPDCCL
jgi:hypothetical protein